MINNGKLFYIEEIKSYPTGDGSRQTVTHSWHLPQSPISEYFVVILWAFVILLTLT